MRWTRAFKQTDLCVLIFLSLNRELKYVIQRFAEDPRQEVCVCVFRLISALSLRKESHPVCVLSRSTPACSACVQGKMAGSSSTVQEAWPVMTTESSLPVWWVYEHTCTHVSIDTVMLNCNVTHLLLFLLSSRFISWWAPAIRPRSSSSLWLKISWAPACCWPSVETKPWWRWMIFLPYNHELCPALLNIYTFCSCVSFCGFFGSLWGVSTLLRGCFYSNLFGLIASHLCNLSLSGCTFSHFGHPAHVVDTFDHISEAIFYLFVFVCGHLVSPQ